MLCLGVSPGAAEQVSANVVEVIGLVDDFSGTKITLDDEQGRTFVAVVGADNQFVLEDVPYGLYVATFKGRKHLTRKVRLVVQAGGPNRFEDITLVRKKGFKLKLFNQIWRGNYSQIRWLEAPKKVVLDDDYQPGSGSSVAAELDSLKTLVTEMTLGLFSTSEFVTRQVSIDFPTSFNPATVACDLRGVSDLSMVLYSGFGGGKCAENDGEVRRSVATASAELRSPQLLKAIGASLGAGVPKRANNKASIMGGATEFTGVDLRHWAYVYSRPPSVRTPDDAAHLAALEGFVDAEPSEVPPGTDGNGAVTVCGHKINKRGNVGIPGAAEVSWASGSATGALVGGCFTAYGVTGAASATIRSGNWGAALEGGDLSFGGLAPGSSSSRFAFPRWGLVHDIGVDATNRSPWDGGTNTWRIVADETVFSESQVQVMQASVDAAFPLVGRRQGHVVRGSIDDPAADWVILGGPAGATADDEVFINPLKPEVMIAESCDMHGIRSEPHGFSDHYGVCSGDVGRKFDKLWREFLRMADRAGW